MSVCVYLVMQCWTCVLIVDDWSWVMARRKQKKRKVLAGFARAIGDGALVATVHDVVVLPELQGLGLGRKLLAKITTQVGLAPSKLCRLAIICHYKSNCQVHL